MAYTAFTKYYQIAQFAQYTYGDKLTMEQLKTSITMIIGTTDPRTIEKYVLGVLKDYSPVCHAQIQKQDVDTYLARPNRPKTPNQLIGEAYNVSHP